MSITRRKFGVTENGKEFYLYILENTKGMKAEITNYGAILVNLYVPDKNGKIDDIVLGFDKGEDYFGNPSFFGATIGPSANRIKDAQITIDQTVYQLDKNDGDNNLHSHAELGFHKKLWEVRESEDGVNFMLRSNDGDMGFPGNKKISVNYRLTEENELVIHYHGISDKKTVLNLTNHTYFNLAGHKAEEIYEDILWLNANSYTPIVAGGIPTGEIAQVAGTPMDFTTPKKIGLEIDADFEQLKMTRGYDHNWVLNDYNGEVRLAARLENTASGRIMETYTNLPGVQFYAGNCIDTQRGKEGAAYSERKALCLETQFFPNAANEPKFPQPIFGAGTEYDSTTIYKFIR